MKKFKKLSAFLETSSGITPNVPTLKRFIKILSGFGYDRFYIGMADAYKIESEPRFGYKRGGYTVSDLKEIDRYAKTRGIEVVPQIQLLGHLHYLSKYPEYQVLFDTKDTLIVGDERVYEFIEKMIKTVSAGLSSRVIHIGLDETFGIGTGNYLKNNPPADKKELILRHIERVNVILEKYGYESVEMWGDMLLEKGDSSVTLEEIKNRLPRNSSVIVWNYEVKDEKRLSEMLSDGEKITDKLAFAGAVWKWLGFGANNAFSTDCILEQMRVCEKFGVENYLVTLWADNVSPCSVFAALPSLFVAAEYANGNIEGIDDLNKDKFLKEAGISYDDILSLDFLDNPFKEVSLFRSSSSVWVLYTDILLGNFDSIIPNGADKAYLALAKEYDGKIAGEYGYLFKTASSLAKLLAVKATLPSKIRKAYAENDKKSIEKSISLLRKLKKKSENFLSAYEEYFLHDNMPFGVEIYHLRLGELIVRCEYAVRRLKAFLDSGAKIEELEGGILPLGYEPMPTISCSIMVDPKLLVSYCLS